MPKQVNLTFSKESRIGKASELGRKTGYVSCDICKDEVTFGKASCGVLKHCCGMEHVKKCAPHGSTAFL